MNDKRTLTDDSLDDLLRSAVAAQTAPADVRRSVRAAVAREQSHGTRRLGIAAAAAVACVALGWAAAMNRSTHTEAAAVAPLDGNTQEELLAAQPPVEFTTADHIVLRHEQVAPNVTVVQLVPTYEAEKRSRREALARSIRNRVAQRGGAS